MAEDRWDPWWVFSRLVGGRKRFVYAWAPAPGTRRQRLLPTHVTSERAARRYADINHADLRDSEARRRTGPKSPTVRDLAERWMRHQNNDARLSVSTREGRASHMRVHIMAKLGDLEVAALGVPELRAFVRELSKARGSSTCRNVVATLRTFLDDVIGEEWAVIKANPVRSEYVVKLLPDPVGGQQSIRLKVDQGQALIGCPAVSLRNRAMYALAFTTGMRPGEIAGLRWSDVALDASPPRLHIKTAIQLRGPKGHATRGKTKTKNSVRTLPIHPAAVDGLREWRDDGWEFAVGEVLTPDAPVFPTASGKAGRERTAQMIRADLILAELPTKVDDVALEFRSARRTFSSELAANRVPKEVRDRLMGHRPATVGEQHYTEHDLDVDAGYVSTIDLRWVRVHDASDAPCAKPKAHKQQKRNEGKRRQTKLESTDALNDAHGGFDFLNRRSEDRALPGAPESTQDSSAACADDERVRTRSRTRRTRDEANPPIAQSDSPGVRKIPPRLARARAELDAIVAPFDAADIFASRLGGDR